MGLGGERRQEHRGGERKETEWKKLSSFFYFSFLPSTVSHWANPPKAVVRELGNMACRRKVRKINLEAKRQNLEKGLKAQKGLIRRSGEPGQVRQTL